MEATFTSLDGARARLPDFVVYSRIHSYFTFIHSNSFGRLSIEYAHSYSTNMQTVHILSVAKGTTTVCVPLNTRLPREKTN